MRDNKSFFEQLKQFLKEKKKFPESVAQDVVNLLTTNACFDLQNLNAIVKRGIDRFTTKYNSTDGVFDALKDYVEEQEKAKTTPRAWPLPLAGPNNGIDFNKFYLKRDKLVDELLETLHCKKYVVVSSPPAMGKTSLLQLIQAKLLQTKDKVATVAYRFPSLKIGANDAHIQQQQHFKANTPFDFNNKDATEEKFEEYDRVYLIIDDAQSMYDEAYWGFWEQLVKVQAFSENLFKKLYFVFAATYDLSTTGSPIQFMDLPHIPDRKNGKSLRVSKKEAELLYQDCVSNLDLDGWHKSFFSELFDLSNGHIGVLRYGLRMLEERDTMNRTSPYKESEAQQDLRGDLFLITLGRCFPRLGTGDSVDQGMYEGLIYEALRSERPIDRPGQNTGNELLLALERSGILNLDGSFTCHAAMWYYYEYMFPRRATRDPESLRSLIVESVKSISSARLRDAQLANARFPKETAIQHLMNEAMYGQLPIKRKLIPELNTKLLEKKNGQTGSLDFYVNGNLKWAVELMVEGKGISEHFNRFDSVGGKYREVDFNDYYVVDFRFGPYKEGNKRKKTDPSLCTFYFVSDYTSCTVVCNNKSEVVPLKP